MTTDADSLRAGLHRFGLERDRLRAALSRSTGIPETDLTALEYLELDGPLTPKQLAERLVLTTGGATLLIDRLERAGWVERRPHPQDRRSLVLHLRPGADAATPPPLADYHAALTTAVRKTPREHRAAVARFLEMCTEAAASASEGLRS